MEEKQGDLNQEVKKDDIKTDVNDTEDKFNDKLKKLSPKVHADLSQLIVTNNIDMKKLPWKGKNQDILYDKYVAKYYFENNKNLYDEDPTVVMLLWMYWYVNTCSDMDDRLHKIKIKNSNSNLKCEPYEFRQSRLPERSIQFFIALLLMGNVFSQRSLKKNDDSVPMLHVLLCACFLIYANKTGDNFLRGVSFFPEKKGHEINGIGKIRKHVQACCLREAKQQLNNLLKECNITLNDDQKNVVNQIFQTFALNSKNSAMVNYAKVLYMIVFGEFQGPQYFHSDYTHEISTVTGFTACEIRKLEETAKILLGCLGRPCILSSYNDNVVSQNAIIVNTSICPSQAYECCDKGLAKIANGKDNNSKLDDWVFVKKDNVKENFLTLLAPYKENKLDHNKDNDFALVESPNSKQKADDNDNEDNDFVIVNPV